MTPAPPSPARIRRMTARDLRRVAALEAVCFGAEAWPLQSFKELLAAFAKAEPSRGEMWIAEDPGTGELLGYAGVEVSALWGEMDVINIAVAPEHRRRGVGRALLGWIVRRCRREGVPLLWLRVRASNRTARRFYRRLGFRQRGRFDGYYQDPDEPAIIMAVDVDPTPDQDVGREAVPAPGNTQPGPRARGGRLTGDENLIQWSATFRFGGDPRLGVGRRAGQQGGPVLTAARPGRAWRARQ